MYNEFYSFREYKDKEEVLNNFALKTGELSDIQKQLELTEKLIHYYFKVSSDDKFVTKALDNLQRQLGINYRDKLIGVKIEDISKHVEKLNKFYTEFRDTSDSTSKRRAFKNFTEAAQEYSDIRQNLCLALEIAQGLSDSGYITETLSNIPKPSELDHPYEWINAWCHNETGETTDSLSQKAIELRKSYIAFRGIKYESKYTINNLSEEARKVTDLANKLRKVSLPQISLQNLSITDADDS